MMLSGQEWLPLGMLLFMPQSCYGTDVNGFHFAYRIFLLHAVSWHIMFLYNVLVWCSSSVGINLWPRLPLNCNIWHWVDFLVILYKSMYIYIYIYINEYIYWNAVDGFMLSAYCKIKVPFFSLGKSRSVWFMLFTFCCFILTSLSSFE